MPIHVRALVLSIALGATVLSACVEREVEPLPTVAVWHDGYRVLFVGDVYFGTSYRGLDERIAEQSADFGFVRLEPFLKSADLVIGNLESPIIDPATSPPSEDSIGYRHWIDVATVPLGLVKQGFDALSLANNHALDQGSDGLARTLTALARNRIESFGAGPTQVAAERPFETTIATGDVEVRLAVFGAFEYFEKYDTRHHIYADGNAPGVARLSAERTADLVRDYKARNPDAFVVAFPHWGGNYAWKTAAQTPIAKALLKAGADTVIGHGAHTVQEIERLGAQTVIYNIGNFVFATPGRYGQFDDITPYGFAALVRFTVEAGRLRADARLYPIATDPRTTAYQPRPLSDAEFAGLRQTLDDRSGRNFSEHAQAAKDALGPFFEVRLK